MATRIRLQRHGRKGKPVYNIVIADQKSPRDGKFIEKLGIYNPNTNPATINLNFDSTVEWMMKGAQPSDTAKSILSYKGILMKKHLLEGVRKGAFNEEEAEKRFTTWMEGKNKKVSDKSADVLKSNEEAKKTALSAETAKNEARAAEIESKNIVVNEEEESTEEVSEETPLVETTTEEVVDESPVDETKTEAVVEEAPAVEETVTEEVVEETPVVVETVAEEVVEETPETEENTKEVKQETADTETTTEEVVEETQATEETTEEEKTKEA